LTTAKPGPVSLARRSGQPGPIRSGWEFPGEDRRADIEIESPKTRSRAAPEAPSGPDGPDVADATALAAGRVIGSLGPAMAVLAADVPVDPPTGDLAEQAPIRPAPRTSPTNAPTTADRR
jgi:hypothetical protein